MVWSKICLPQAVCADRSIIGFRAKGEVPFGSPGTTATPSVVSSRQTSSKHAVSGIALDLRLES